MACATALIYLSDSRYSDMSWSSSFGRSSSGIAEVARVLKEAQKERVENDGGASGGRMTKPSGFPIRARVLGALERLARAPHSHIAIDLASAAIRYR